MPSICTFQTNTHKKAVVEVLQNRRGLLRSLVSGSGAGGRVVDETDANEGSEDERQRNRLMILFPGNPGNVVFYREFVRILDEKGFDVLVMGFAGHSFANLNKGKLFDLQDQIDVADDFTTTVLHSSHITDYNGELYVAGHSIGGFVGWNMLARHPEFKLYFGLCPVLSRIAESPNGRQMFYWGIPLLQWAAALTAATLFSLLPRFVRRFVVDAKGKDVDAATRRQLADGISFNLLMNVFYLSFDEFRSLTAPDEHLLRHLQHRMALFYVPRDGWAPQEFTEEIRDLCPRLFSYTMCSDATVPHAWCLQHNDEIFESAIAPHI